MLKLASTTVNLSTRKEECLFRKKVAGSTLAIQQETSLVRCRTPEAVVPAKALTTALWLRADVPWSAGSYCLGRLYLPNSKAICNHTNGRLTGFSGQVCGWQTFDSSPKLVRVVACLQERCPDPTPARARRQKEQFLFSRQMSSSRATELGCADRCKGMPVHVIAVPHKMVLSLDQIWSLLTEACRYSGPGVRR